MDAGHFSDLEVLDYFQWPAGPTSVFDYKRICAASVNLATVLKKKCVEKWPYFPIDPLIHGLLQILSFNEYKMIFVLSIILLI